MHAHSGTTGWLAFVKLLATTCFHVESFVMYQKSLSLAPGSAI